MKKITLLTHIFDLVELHSTMGAIEKNDTINKYHWSVWKVSQHVYKFRTLQKKKKENNDKNYRNFFGEFTIQAKNVL